jgi:CDP-diacylglycerol pyrophosphatase
MSEVFMPAVRSAGIVAAAVLFAAVLAAVMAYSANPNALREIVDGKCIPNMQQHGDPKPCAQVDLTGGTARGFAILKDIRGASQFLLIPTEDVDGIESPALLAPDAVNYFDDAWTARSFTEKALGRTMPRDALSLAINSKYGRTQNQLHIHIDCIAPYVRDVLHNERYQIHHQWKLLDEPLAGHRYYAMRVVLAETLVYVDPFQLLADGIVGAREDMGSYTLVVVGVEKLGFIILADRADLMHGDTGSGEELQDHYCALAKQ